MTFSRTVRSLLLGTTLSLGIVAPALAEDLNIGFIAPMTGGFAQVGKDMVDGFQMYLDEVNGDFAGAKVKFILEDDQAKPDLGVTKATDGWMRAQVTSALTGMTQPTGWHYHVCEGQFVYTLKGWVELEFEDGTNCRLEAGDSVFIPGGMLHQENRTSDDLEILEVSVPADMGTVAVDPPAKRTNGA